MYTLTTPISQFTLQTLIEVFQLFQSEPTLQTVATDDVQLSGEGVPVTVNPLNRPALTRRLFFRATGLHAGTKLGRKSDLSAERHNDTGLDFTYHPRSRRIDPPYHGIPPFPQGPRPCGTSFVWVFSFRQTHERTCIPGRDATHC
ncbi:hypothetical protein PQQ99_36850 [Paraburkholderia sediminicola]|uniref:hypothetical protein n=1 Tax=Paraburkholderia sediminicola TaxID=458836 RepID=UPI0038BDC001